MFVIPPVFKECTYELDNIAIVPMSEHFRYLSELHQRLTNVPDGAQVQIKVVP